MAVKVINYVGKVRHAHMSINEFVHVAAHLVTDVHKHEADHDKRRRAADSDKAHKSLAHENASLCRETKEKP